MSFTFRNIAISGLASLCLLAAIGLEAQEQSTATLPLLAGQQKLADCNFQSSDPVSVGNAAMKVDADGTVTLSGRDKTGLPWTATYPAFPGAGCQLWQARLERRAEPALVFVAFGGNTSGGWDTTLSVLLFDAQDRPFPWQAKGEFSVTDHGIDGVVQLGAASTAAVLVRTRQSDGPGNHLDSHSLYTFSGVRAVEVHGESEGKHWPFDVPTGSPKWSLRQASPSALDTLQTSGVSGSADTRPENASRFEGIKGTNDSDHQIILSGGSTYFPDLLVIDTQSGRRIVSYPTLTDLTDVKAGKAAGVALGNNCSEGNCHPVVTWLRQ